MDCCSLDISNVLVSSSMVAKLADLGLARREFNSEYYAASNNSNDSGTLILPIRSVDACIMW